MKTNKEKYEYYAAILREREKSLLQTVNVPDTVSVIEGNYRNGNFGVVACSVIAAYYSSKDTWRDPKDPYTKKDVERDKLLSEENNPLSIENVFVEYQNGTRRASYIYSDPQRRGVYLSRDEADREERRIHEKYDLKPGDIHCAYCARAFPEKDAISIEIFYRMDGGLRRKTNQYCSRECGSHDQMAHEG
jgi:hypothetical protein